MVLKLPPDSYMKCKGFVMPGEETVNAMDETFRDQRKMMVQHVNRAGHLSRGDTGTGDTPCLPPSMEDKAEAAATFAYSELVANILDQMVNAGLLKGVEIKYIVDTTTGAITLTRGDGEGFAGFAPTNFGIVLWNMSTPFSPAALVRGGKTRPKKDPVGGTGGFNYGLKQCIKYLLGVGAQVSFSFIGYLKPPEPGSEKADDEVPRPAAGLYAETTYRWVPTRKDPNVIKFKENPLSRCNFKCNVPILKQVVTWETWQQGSKNPTREFAQEFCNLHHSFFAKALAAFERLYTCDHAAETVVRGIPYFEKTPEGWVNLGSPEILHRDCFSLLLEKFGNHKIELPSGPLLLVGERFYQISDGSGFDNLVLSIPGKGMAGEYKAFASEARDVTIGRFVELLATVVVNVINAVDKDNAETLRIRNKLAQQLMPLLVGGESPIFGDAKGGLMSTLMTQRIIQNNINMLRNLLIREVLRGSPEAKVLSDKEFEAKIMLNPIVHAGADIPRASVLAHIIGTFQLSVVSDNVHPLLFRSTNLPMAEKRALAQIHVYNRESPPKMPESLQKVSDFVLGKNTEVAYLPLPDDEALSNAAVAFRYDDDSIDIHRVAMWQSNDPFNLVKQICDLRVTGVKVQMNRADAVRTALQTLKHKNHDLDTLCDKVMENLSWDTSDQENEKVPDLKDWANNSLLKKSPPKKRPIGDFSSSSDSDDDLPLDQRKPAKNDLPLNQPKSAKKSKNLSSSTTTGGTPSEPAYFAAQPGKDGGDVTEVLQTISRPDGKCDFHEPPPGDPCVVNNLNQRLITVQGISVYVPQEFDANNSHIQGPELLKRFGFYTQVRWDIVRHIGIPYNVMPTWSPEASWSGIALEREKLILVNLAVIATRGWFLDTILHELAHVLVGAQHGHNQLWYSKLAQLHASYYDTKKTSWSCN